MVDPKFTTVGTSLGGYRGVMQHEAIYDQKKTLDILAENTAYNKSDIKAVLVAFGKVLKRKLQACQAVAVPNGMRVYQTVRGGFLSSVGPWVKGKNYIAVNALSVEPIRSVDAALRPTNNTQGAKPVIDTIACNGLYNTVISGQVVTITGKNLLPDTTTTDEFVAIYKTDGTLVKKGVISNTSLILVDATFDLTGVEAGTYVLAVYTRSGMGEEYGVAKATRTITVAAA